MIIFISGSKSPFIKKYNGICLTKHLQSLTPDSNETKGHGLFQMKRECIFIKVKAMACTSSPEVHAHASKRNIAGSRPKSGRLLGKYLL